MYITFRQLKVFVAVFQFSSTTIAAKKLALSQSAVSMAISELENQLDQSLFERLGKRLVVNESAKKLYPKAVALLNQADELQNIFSASQGYLNIGASTTIGNYILPAILANFQKKYPQIETPLYIHNTEDIAQNLCQLNYDLGFIEGQYSDNVLISENWLSDELVLFVAKNSRFIAADSQYLTLADLIKLPLILREQGSGTRNTIEQQLLTSLPQVKIIEIGHSEAIKQAVVNDMGIGCLSYYTLDDLLALDKIRIIQLQNITIKRYFRLIYHQQKYKSSAWQLFYDFCYQYVKN